MYSENRQLEEYNHHCMRVNAPSIGCVLSLLYGYRCLAIPQIATSKVCTFLFVVWLQKEYPMMDLRVINFPDKVFKKYLIDNFDKDGDGEISLTEALTISKVLCSQKGIKSIAGIEHLSNLEVLDCSRNEIENIDISENKKLKHLSCYSNPICSLNIKENQHLITLYCGNCNIDELDCSQNKDLEILSCRFNPLREIDLWINRKLSVLRVRRCQLEELELRSLKELQFVDCSENKLYELQLFENKELTYLDCARNDLHNDLYVGANTKLKYLDCRMNKCLDSITISEGQTIEEVRSDIPPMTETYRKYLLWRNYQSDNIEDTSWEDGENWENQRFDAFEGDESNYWNID